MLFGQLTATARIYILAVYAFAAAIVAGEWLFSVDSVATVRTAWPWLLFVVLTAAASVSHAFPVGTPGRQAYHVSLPFFVAAVILLEPLQVAALLVVVHIVEFLRRRRSWYAQVFNVAAYIVTAAAAQFLFHRLGPDPAVPPFDLGNPHSLVAAIVAVAAFLLVNRALVCGAIWLGNHIPPRHQQMFDWEALFTDCVLLAMGLPLAQLALIAPWTILLSAMPLVLIYRALELPSIRAQRRQDSLTQLFTASYFTEVCNREVHRARRFGRPLALLVLDIDRLSRINAEFSRQAGDAVIQGVARLLDQISRDFDIAARIVGGEFAVLLPETDLAAAHQAAERFRQSIADHRFEVVSSLEPLRATVSIGLAASAGGQETTEHLFAAAAAAVAQAKYEGGNRIAIVSGSTAPMTEAGVGELNPPEKPAGVLTEPIVVEDAPAARSGANSVPAGTAVTPAVGLAAAGASLLAVAPPPAAPSGRLARWLAAYPEQASIVVALGAALGAFFPVIVAIPQIPSLDPVTIGVLVVLALIAEGSSLELYGLSSYSIGAVPTLAAGMLLGVPGAVVVAPISSIIRGVQRRSRWYKIVFNAATYILAAAGASAVFGTFAGPLTPANLGVLLIAAALAGLVYYFHTLIVSVALATQIRTNPIAVWGDNFRWLWPQYVVLSQMGLLLSLAYREYGIVGAAVFVIPPLMMRYVAKQYIDRTLGNVRQLRALNEQLATEVAQRTAAEAENVRLVQERAEARVAALEELNRLKSEFISIASHELRTPMASILGFSELLLGQTDEDDPRRQFLSFIYEDSQQLASLVDNLLDVSRIESGRLTIEQQRIDLIEFLTPILQSLGASTAEHRLRLDVDEEARWIDADAEKLHQIVTNLVSNAIKYSPRGGEVVVGARRSPGGEQILLTVSDQGLGIPKDDQDRIFDRFQRVNTPEARNIRGTGLGLYIVRQIVELHGGTIRVESELGRGSTFHVVLPTGPASPPPAIDGTAAEVTPPHLVGTSR